MDHFRTGLYAAVIALAACAGEAEVKASDLSSEIRTEAGLVRGTPRDAHDVLAFKGIPYAAAPVGKLRWHAPQPPSPWSGVRDAVAHGARCLSALEKDREPGPRSEDCLYLNVWTAANSTAEKRPVMVWVHGGGFQFGSSAGPAIDGTALAQKGVIVVSFNYRLGVLGFLAHPDLDAEGPSGNYGLQDQLAALRWVKGNIAGFGGDPDNVTLFGESAGAHAIGILMTSPLAQGLFHKAIGESGAFWDGRNGPLESFEEARARGQAFTRQQGDMSIAALRALPAEHRAIAGAGAVVRLQRHQQAVSGVGWAPRHGLGPSLCRQHGHDSPRRRRLGDGWRCGRRRPVGQRAAAGCLNSAGSGKATASELGDIVPSSRPRGEGGPACKIKEGRARRPALALGGASKLTA